MVKSKFNKLPSAPEERTQPDRVIMSTVHLIQGNAIPPKKEGVLRLYSMRFCPCAHRVRILFLLKNLPHDIVNINLAKKPDWIWKLNPEGKIPILDTGSEIMAESLDICDYLNDKYPDPPLYPSDEGRRGADKRLIKKFQEDKAMFFTVILNENKKTLAEYASEYMHILEDFDKELANRGKFFGGISPNMVDYMIWPWVERSVVANYIYPEKYDIPEHCLLHLRRWYSEMSNLEVVKATTLDIHRYAKYYKQYPLKATIQYDD